MCTPDLCEVSASGCCNQCALGSVLAPTADVWTWVLLSHESFGSGKVVITGAKKRELIHTALDNIYSILQEYRKQ